MGDCPFDVWGDRISYIGIVRVDYVRDWVRLCKDLWPFINLSDLQDIFGE